MAYSTSVPPIQHRVFPSTPLSPAYISPTHLPPTTPWTQPYAIPLLPQFTSAYFTPRTLPHFTPCANHTPLPATFELAPDLAWPALRVIPPPTPYFQPDLSCYDFPDHLEPGTFPAVPFGTPVPIRIHPNLIYNPVNPIIPSLRWDISHHPEQAIHYTGRLVMIKPDLSSPATTPAAGEMHIYSDHQLLAWWMKSWGPIIVKKDGMTVYDVLRAISDYMRQPLTTEEVDRIERSGGKPNLEFSAAQRIKDGHDIPAVARQMGYRRVDALGSHRTFQGLRVETFWDKKFKVFMGLMPRSNV